MRKIIQLAGASAQFALADDGTIWLWSEGKWVDASRGRLPDPAGPTPLPPDPIAPKLAGVPVRVWPQEDPPKAHTAAITAALNTATFPAVKRGPGRPRKNPEARRD